MVRNSIRALGAAHGRAVGLSRNDDGAVAIEFAIVAPAFFALLLAIAYTALIFLAQQMLETTAQNAGRLLLTGAAQSLKVSNGDVGMTAADFKNAICNGTTGTDANGNPVTIPSLLPPMLTCSRLTVNVTTASSYSVQNGAAPTFTYDSNGNVTSTGTGYNPQSGGSGQSKIVILQLIYLWPTGTGPLGLNMINQANGSRMLIATSAFTTEAYSCNTSQTSC